MGRPEGGFFKIGFEIFILWPTGRQSSVRTSAPARKSSSRKVGHHNQREVTVTLHTRRLGPMAGTDLFQKRMCSLNSAIVVGPHAES